MNYRRLSNEELKKQTYPNLIAEWLESGYSFCTLGERLGLGSYREEGDSEVLAKMTGKDELVPREAIELCKLFGVKMEYLFSHELKCIDEKPMAYLRWYESNKRKEEELRQYKAREEILRNLQEKPYLLEMFSVLVEMSQQELNRAFIQYRIGGAGNE